MPEEGRQPDRTWLCSVLFLDIASYSSQSVARQMAWKELFNRALKEALASVAADDRVILDTGDGAAVCFLGEPESAVLCAMTLLRTFLDSQTPDIGSPALRVGINLGPVRLVNDINGNLNAIGDGINVGQRIMSFAGENQILVSRSYFEVVSSLSDDFKRLFQFHGVRQDKHVREHAVYAIATSGGVSRADEPPPLKVVLDTADLDAIVSCLGNLVGPIARHLVTKASNTATTLTALCDALAAAVPQNERDIFLKCCRHRLGARLDSEAKPAPATAAPPPANWDAAFLNELKKELAQQIGVIARVVVDRAAKRCTTPTELYRLLATEIVSETDRKAFLAKKEPYR
jgi:class 3 adenylate cyclase